MGSWFAVRSGIGYTYAAIADTVEQDTREKFKCLVIQLALFYSLSLQNKLFSLSLSLKSLIILFNVSLSHSYFQWKPWLIHGITEIIW
jgi:hypothetical protein